MAAEAELRTGGPEQRTSGYDLLQALVGIRLRSVSDPESQHHLTWLSDMVAAIALISRRMPANGPIDFAAYLDDAADFWRKACAGRGVRIDVRASHALLPDSHALPLAIILHELMANAVRHAFPAGMRGAIAVACSSATDGVSLVVRDSGVGGLELIPGDGLRLVEGLVERLGGVLTIEAEPGAGVGVRVRLPLGNALPH
jgi:two-component sensor histidine kinase